MIAVALGLVMLVAPAMAGGDGDRCPGLREGAVAAAEGLDRTDTDVLRGRIETLAAGQDGSRCQAMAWVEGATMAMHAASPSPNLLVPATTTERRSTEMMALADDFLSRGRAAREGDVLVARLDALREQKALTTSATPSSRDYERVGRAWSDALWLALQEARFDPGLTTSSRLAAMGGLRFSLAALRTEGLDAAAWSQLAGLARHCTMVLAPAEPDWRALLGGAEPSPLDRSIYAEYRVWSEWADDLGAEPSDEDRLLAEALLLRVLVWGAMQGLQAAPEEVYRELPHAADLVLWVSPDSLQLDREIEMLLGKRVVTIDAGPGGLGEARWAALAAVAATHLVRVRPVHKDDDAQIARIIRALNILGWAKKAPMDLAEYGAFDLEVATDGVLHRAYQMLDVDIPAAEARRRVEMLPLRLLLDLDTASTVRGDLLIEIGRHHGDRGRRLEALEGAARLGQQGLMATTNDHMVQILGSAYFYVAASDRLSFEFAEAGNLDAALSSRVDQAFLRARLIDVVDKAGLDATLRLAPIGDDGCFYLEMLPAYLERVDATEPAIPRFVGELESASSRADSQGTCREPVDPRGDRHAWSLVAPDGEVPPALRTRRQVDWLLAEVRHVAPSTLGRLGQRHAILTAVEPLVDRGSVVARKHEAMPQAEAAELALALRLASEALRAVGGDADEVEHLQTLSRSLSGGESLPMGDLATSRGMLSCTDIGCVPLPPAVLTTRRIRIEDDPVPSADTLGIEVEDDPKLSGWLTAELRDAWEPEAVVALPWPLEKRVWVTVGDAACEVRDRRGTSQVVFRVGVECRLGQQVATSTIPSEDRDAATP